MNAPRTAPARSSAGSTHGDRSLRLGIWGRGRLGSAVAELAEESGHRVAWLAGRGTSEPAAPDADVLIDASVGEAVPEHLERALCWQRPLVIAATGWRIDDLEARVGDRIGVVVAPNGSLGVALIEGWARQLGAYARALGGTDVAHGFLLDHHHAEKRDAPSGTALRLAEAWQDGRGSGASEDGPRVASIRAGHEVGYHVLGLDSAGELLEIHHRARSRRTFADGLLAAARWLGHRRGVFGMRHVAADLFAAPFLGSAPFLGPTDSFENPSHGPGSDDRARPIT